MRRWRFNPPKRQRVAKHTGFVCPYVDSRRIVGRWGAMNGSGSRTGNSAFHIDVMAGLGDSPGGRKPTPWPALKVACFRPQPHLFGTLGNCRQCGRGGPRIVAAKRPITALLNIVAPPGPRRCSLVLHIGRATYPDKGLNDCLWFRPAADSRARPLQSERSNPAGHNTSLQVDSFMSWLRPAIPILI